MYVQASIPTTSLLLAVAGCTLVLLGGIIIVLVGKHGEGALDKHRTWRKRSRTQKIPPLMLSLQLRDATGGGIVANSLGTLRVENVVLTNVADATQHYVVG